MAMRPTHIGGERCATGKVATAPSVHDILPYAGTLFAVRWPLEPRACAAPPPRVGPGGAPAAVLTADGGAATLAYTRPPAPGQHCRCSTCDYSCSWGYPAAVVLGGNGSRRRRRGHGARYVPGGRRLPAVVTPPSSPAILRPRVCSQHRPSFLELARTVSASAAAAVAQGCRGLQWDDYVALVRHARRTQEDATAPLTVHSLQAATLAVRPRSGDKNGVGVPVAIAPVSWADIGGLANVKVRPRPRGDHRGAALTNAWWQRPAAGRCAGLPCRVGCRARLQAELERVVVRFHHLQRAAAAMNVRPPRGVLLCVSHVAPPPACAREA